MTSTEISTFASRGVSAYHGIGTVFGEGESVTTNDMITKAGLDFEVSLAPLVTNDADALEPGAYATVRTDPSGHKSVLGVVGQRYTVVQNRDALAFADNILDGGGRWEVAGSIKDGAVVFGAMAVLEDLVIDPQGANDVIKSYLGIATSHDGSSAISAFMTPVRIECSNTLNLAIKGAKNAFKIRHTQTVEGKVIAARQSLNLATAYYEKFEKEAQTLFQTSVTNDKFDEIVRALYPEPDRAEAAKVAVTKWDNRRERLFGLWNGSTNANIAGTAWAALNAITEENQWFRQIRSGNTENAFAAGAGFDDATNAFRNRALNAVHALV
jgi:phage/plasmid-like protein (TIGR03299 family)